VRQSQVDAGQRPGASSEESAELKRLKRENAELRRANEPGGLAGLDIHPALRRRIDHGLSSAEPHVD
jgi:transposase-like protein